jgi:nitronate monooxygenase
MVLYELRAPVVLAPLAGGPFTPALAAAVSEAGGLGFVAAGYLTAAGLGARVRETRELTARPIGVNVFVPGPAASPAALEAYVARMAEEAARAGVEAGAPVHDDDDWEAKLALLLADPVAVVSFTFGCPSREVIARLRAAGSEVWVTVTSPAEAREAADAGADVMVVQGAEAGGHRGSFTDGPDVPLHPLIPLLGRVAGVTDVPLVAAGGIADRPGVAAALEAGARAVQPGTAFLLCPEAGTAEVHRRAIASPAATTLTRVFTGRLARGIRNRFTDEHERYAPVAYPEIHHVTAALRRAGRATGDGDVVNLWAGVNHTRAEARPAAEVVAALSPAG